MVRIALVPLDDRPVTYDLPARVGAVGGAEVLMPPRALLGNLTRVADCAAIGAWLEEIGPQVDVAVLALDTLAYGGLIPGRRSPDDLATVMARLAPLTRLHAAHPALPLYAFNVTMRLSDSDVNEEEKPYWDQYGKAIFRWSFHQHRAKAAGEPDDRQIAQAARATIPAEILDDYMATRTRNFTFNQTMVKWTGADVFTLLALTQDDTATFGVNVEEQQQLSEMVTVAQLTDRVLIYPGADEVASVLVARAMNKLAGRTPTIAVSWHPLEGKRVQAMYEDRPLWQTLRGQIRAVGGKEISDESAADLLLVVNAPSPAGQGDLALGTKLERVTGRNPEPPIVATELALAAGKPVGLADVAYANGAENVFMDAFVKRVDPFKLAGFGAWNTAGNTFGSLVAAACAATLPTANDAARKRLLTERLADDWVYQSVVRPGYQRARTPIPELELADDMAEAWAERFPTHPRHFKTYFPWHRLFEAGVSQEDPT